MHSGSGQRADGLEMSFETGKLAQLADGAVVVRVGDTTLLSHRLSRQQAP